MRVCEKEYESKYGAQSVQSRSKGLKLLISMPVDSFDYHQSLPIAASFFCSMPFASWLWTEMGLSARLSFEVLWLSAKRSAVPAAICEEAASSRPSLLFPSVTERGWSQEWKWGWRRHLVHVGWPHMVVPIAVSVSMNMKAYTVKPSTSMP